MKRQKEKWKGRDEVNLIKRLPREKNSDRKRNMQRKRKNERGYVASSFWLLLTSNGFGKRPVYTAKFSNNLTVRDFK